MSKKLLFFIAFLEGGVVMLLEILIPLVISPIVGKSVIIWSVLISLSVGALSIGYYIGGLMASKDDKIGTLQKLFIINSLILVFGWLIYAYQNYSSTSSLEAYSWVIVLFILFLPLIIFGSTTPIIIALINEAKKVGNVFSVSTFGGIIFCIITGFFLVPIIGVSKTILIACLITSLASLFLYLGVKAFNKATYVFMLLTLILVLYFSVDVISRNNSSKDVAIIEHIEGIDGQLIVADINYNNGVQERLLLVNRTSQTWMNKQTGFSIWSYNGIISSMASIYPEGSNALLMGLGGGVIARQLIDHNFQNVDVVELDSRIVDISKKYFGLNKYSQINFFIDDARRYMKYSQKKYEIIVMDIYNGEFIPSHTLSKEALVDIQNILTEDGVVLINFNGFISGKEGQAARCFIKTVLNSELKIQVYASQEGSEDLRNSIFVLYKKEPDWSKMKYKSTFNDIIFDVDKSKIDISKLKLENEIVITDDFPLLEYYGRYAAEKWRDSFKYFNLKKLKEENGIIFTK